MRVSYIYIIMKKLLAIFLSLSFILPVLAQTETEQVDIQQKSALKRWWNNLVKGNVDKTFEKPYDLVFAFAPYYSQESKVGFGGQATVMYRLDRTDSIMQPSDFTLLGGASINGNYSFGMQGNTHFTRNKRLYYLAEFRNQIRDYWGINYYDCDINPATHARFNRINILADYKVRFGGNWFWGVSAQLRYGKAKLTDNPEYLLGQKDNAFYAGIGASIMYDTRDYILNPQKGVHFFIRQIYYPSFMGQSDDAIGTTTLQFNYYHHVWPGGLLAYDVYGEFSYSNGEVPWQLRQETCTDDRRMRGYYAGRYTDVSQMVAQVELRQNIYKRLGATVWGGSGTFFEHGSDFFDHFLPTYGVGLRFELKKDTNIRLDVGGGRHAGGLIFGFAEAF